MSHTRIMKAPGMMAGLREEKDCDQAPKPWTNTGAYNHRDGGYGKCPCSLSLHKRMELRGGKEHHAELQSPQSYSQSHKAIQGVDSAPALAGSHGASGREHVGTALALERGI